MAFVFTNFENLLVKDRVSQEDTLKSLSYVLARVNCHKDNAESDEEMLVYEKKTKERVMKYGVSPKFIKSRQLVLALSKDNKVPDSITEKMEDKKTIGDSLDTVIYKDMFKDLNPFGANLGQRMAIYNEVVTKIVDQLYRDVETAPDDIIHVSCSGYLSPSPVQQIVSKKQWLETVVTHCYHMGCYAAIPGMRMAHGFMSTSRIGVGLPKKQIDVVHTELLSLHMDITDDSLEQIIVQTLFSDGFIKYSLMDEEDIYMQELKGLKVLNLNEMILENSLPEMTWTPKQYQFKMTLGITVPVVIKKNIKVFCNKLFNEIGLSFENLKEEIVFAIHPGGPKIIDHIQDELGLTDEQVELSRIILREWGNISSATMPHILKAVLEDDSIAPGTLVISLAFGPGLTAVGGVFEKI